MQNERNIKGNSKEIIQHLNLFLNRLGWGIGWLGLCIAMIIIITISLLNCLLDHLNITVNTLRVQIKGITHRINPIFMKRNPIGLEIMLKIFHLNDRGFDLSKYLFGILKLFIN
jgi:hypothetical protein